jgi:hypothetical protein
MSLKTLLIASVLTGFSFLMASGLCFAGTTKLLEQADIYRPKNSVRPL